jgi:hypothetical protein
MYQRASHVSPQHDHRTTTSISWHLVTINCQKSTHVCNDVRMYQSAFHVSPQHDHTITTSITWHLVTINCQKSACVCKSVRSELSQSAKIIIYLTDHLLKLDQYNNFVFCFYRNWIVYHSSLDELSILHMLVQKRSLNCPKIHRH